MKNLEDSDELDVFNPDDREIFEDGLPDGSSDGDGLDEPLAVNIEEDDEDEFEDPDFIASSDDDLNSESDESDDAESDDDESEDNNSGEDDMNEEDEDKEEAFINGKHQDSEFDYEKERLLNKKVKERLSQLGLSPRTLKNKQRQLARDLESKLISKCAQQKMLERPPKTKPAGKSSRVAAQSSRGAAQSSRGEAKSGGGGGGE